MKSHGNDGMLVLDDADWTICFDDLEVGKKEKAPAKEKAGNAKKLQAGAPEPTKTDTTNKQNKAHEIEEDEEPPKEELIEIELDDWEEGLEEEDEDNGDVEDEIVGLEELLIEAVDKEKKGVSSISAIDAYLKDVCKEALLSVEEERSLVLKKEAGCEASRNILIARNLRLVIKLAKRYRGRGMLFDDLVEEGNIGLIKAIDKFKSEAGCRVSTYATWWIRQALDRTLKEKVRSIRVPVHMEEFLDRRRSLIGQMAARLGRIPYFDELMEEALRVNLLNLKQKGVHRQTIEVFLRARLHAAEQLEVRLNTYSLDQELFEDDEATLGDTIVDTRPSPEDNAEATEEVEKILTPALTRLTDTELLVIQRRFGLDNRDPETLEEIGASLGLTRERIRQIETDALRKMRGIKKERRKHPPKRKVKRT